MATRILFFGKLRDAVGCAERMVDLPPHVVNAATLIDWLAGDDESLKRALCSESVRIAVDQEIAPVGANFQNAAEIAFMPPFSGG